MAETQPPDDVGGEVELPDTIPAGEPEARARPVDRPRSSDPQFEQVWIERHEQVQFSAFPPPDIVRGLERALEGAGDRAFRMAEQEQSHRRRLETRSQEAYIKGLHRGQYLTFFLALAWLLVSVLLILRDESLIGVGFFLADIVFITYSVIRAQPKFNVDEEGTQPPAAGDAMRLDDAGGSE